MNPLPFPPRDHDKGHVNQLHGSLVINQTPLRPPPPHMFFLRKKITPIFLLENASVMAETNFTFGPMFKPNLFPL